MIETRNLNPTVRACARACVRAYANVHCSGVPIRLSPHLSRGIVQPVPSILFAHLHPSRHRPLHLAISQTTHQLPTLCRRLKRKKIPPVQQSLLRVLAVRACCARPLRPLRQASLEEEVRDESTDSTLARSRLRRRLDDGFSAAFLACR